MKKGDVLKLSKEGLDWISVGREGTRARLSTLRFLYIHRGKKYIESISVKRIGSKNRYESYHFSFLELEEKK